MEVKAGFKQTDVGVIPNDWDVCAVRDKGEVMTGKALAAYAPGTQRPYLRTKNVFDGRIDITDVLTMPMTDEQFAKFQVRHGDVLLNEGQSIELVGRCALYRNEHPRPCAIQNQLLRFRAHNGVSEVFASYVFRNCQRTGVFARIALQTTSIAHLGGARFERLRLAWPSSYPEQQAIAQALSDVDDLIQSLERLIAKKRGLKQAAMQQLLTGQTRLPGFSREWQKSLLGAAITLQRGFDLPKRQRTPGSVPIVTSSGIEDFHATPAVPGPGVVTGRYGTIGQVFFVEEDFWPLNTTLYVRDFHGNDPLFISYFLRRIDFRSHSGKSGVPGVNRNDLHSLVISMPHLEEQRAIAEVLSDMDAEITALEARLAKTRDLKKGIMQELLTGRTRLV